jgi:hypothetical protein
MDLVLTTLLHAVQEFELILYIYTGGITTVWIDRRMNGQTEERPGVR